MDIKVSVIVPAYNVEKYIGKCLDSLINQTLKEIEIIVVNDGSTDSTGDIIEIYSRKDSRIKYIKQENAGLAGARNRGLKEAKGEYVAHLDGDDFVEINCYEEVYKYAKDNACDIVITDFYKDYGIKCEYKEDLQLKNNSFIEGRDYIENIFLGNGYPNVWDKIVKRKIYLDNKIEFIQGIFLGEDILTTVRLGYFAEKVGKLNKAYVHYVQHENQGTSKSGLGNKINDLYLVCEKLEKFFQKEKYVSKNFNWYRLNEFFLKFLTCYPMKTKNYLKAKSNFVLGLNEILKMDELKKLKSKHRLRLKICKYLGESKYLDTYLKLKNRKRG